MHSNETWHALNSTFPDTNCIVSFQIFPYWILSNSGMGVATEDGGGGGDETKPHPPH